MAVNTLTEIYAQDMVDNALVNTSIRKAAVWNSGMVYVDPKLASMVGAGEGRKINRVGWNDFANPSTQGNAAQAGVHNPGYPDDSSTNLVPNSNSTYMYDAVKTMVNFSFGQRETIKAISWVQDPVGALAGYVDGYWARFFDIYTAACLIGIAEDNIANDGGDMVAGDGTAAVTDELILDGFATLGDAADIGGIMICHSKVAFTLRKAQLIDTIPSATNPAIYFEYFGRTRMIVTDNVPTKNGTVMTILAMPNVVSFGNSTNNIIPSEVWREPRSGVGSGEEHLITRQQFAVHVDGYTWLDNTVTGSVASGSIPGLNSGDALWPCPADMMLAANWDRKLHRKKIKIAFLWTSETGGGITAE